MEVSSEETLFGGGSLTGHLTDFTGAACPTLTDTRLICPLTGLLTDVNVSLPHSLTGLLTDVNVRVSLSRTDTPRYCGSWMRGGRSVRARRLWPALSFMTSQAPFRWNEH